MDDDPMVRAIVDVWVDVGFATVCEKRGRAFVQMNERGVAWLERVGLRAVGAADTPEKMRQLIAATGDGARDE